jgi:hypothetical protein
VSFRGCCCLHRARQKRGGHDVIAARFFSHLLFIVSVTSQNVLQCMRPEHARHKKRLLFIFNKVRYRPLLN